MARRLTIIELQGDPDLLLATKRRLVDPAFRAVVSRHGLISHLAARRVDGLTVVNLWESASDMEAAYAEPTVRQALLDWAEAMPEIGLPKMQHYEVTDYIAFASE